MKPTHVGITSAIVASLCCLGPLVLVLVGLGSLGLGAFFGRYHWWFIGAAIGLLTFAWRSYFKEKRRCTTAHCEMASGQTTKWTLLLASTVVAVFVGLNVYTYASQGRKSAVSTSPTLASLATIKIPVEGMTCFTCELTVESSLKRLPGVEEADAKVTEEAAYVRYDPSRVSLDELIAAINKTGYKARRPSPSSQGG